MTTFVTSTVLIDVVGRGSVVVGGGGGGAIVETIGSTVIIVATLMAFICCSTACDPAPTVEGMVIVVVEFARGTQVPETVIVFVV